MEVGFCGIGEEFAVVRDQALARVRAVLESGEFVLGRETRQLEAAVCERVGVEHALACSSGSDALVLALSACGIGPGHAVIVPALTFFATAGAVARVGAVPVMADVDAETCNLGAAELEAVVDREFRSEARDGGRLHRRSGARLSAVIVVHLYGRAAGVEGLLRATDALGIPLIEDAAQAFGARTERGPAGSVGRLGCLSFYPTKNLGGAGDGGMVTTRDPALARRLQRLRVHGAEPGSYRHEEIGFNARMGELQAAFLNAKIPMFERWTEHRRRTAEQYRARLQGLAQRGLCRPPAPAAEDCHVYHQFVVGVPERRDRAAGRLRAAGIESRVFYPVPLHLQPCFSSLGYRPGDLPASERLCGEVLALPMGVHMDASRVEAVCASLERALVD